MGKRKYTDEQLVEAVKNSTSVAAVARALDVKGGGAKSSLSKRIEELGLDTSHFTGSGWSKGLLCPRLSMDEILVENSKYHQERLKDRLLSEHVKEAKCEICGRSEWLDQPIPLELHHINRNHFDNRLENLQILCPNCHSYTHNILRKQKQD